MSRAEYCLMGCVVQRYLSESKLQRSVSNVIIITRARKCKLQRVCDELDVLTRFLNVISWPRGFENRVLAATPRLSSELRGYV